MKDITANDTLGLVMAALGPITSAVIVLLLGHDRRLEPSRRPSG